MARAEIATIVETGLPKLMPNNLAGWLVGWLVGRLAGWQAGWLAGSNQRKYLAAINLIMRQLFPGTKCNDNPILGQHSSEGTCQRLVRAAGEGMMAQPAACTNIKN